MIFFKDLKRTFFFLLFQSLAGQALSSLSWAEEFRVKLIPANNPNEIIDALQWDEGNDTQTPILQTRQNGNVREQISFEKEANSSYFVVLQGRFKEKNRTLLFEKNPISAADDGKFTIEVGINSEKQEFTMREINEAGDVKTQIFEIQFPEWKDFLSTLESTSEKKPASKQKFSFQGGLGISAITYSQTGDGIATSNAFAELGFKLQADVRYQFKDFLAFAGESSFTALPLGVGPTGNTIRFLDLGLDIIYPLSFIQSPWKLELVGYYSYRTTLSSQSSFGYSNVQGVTIYPRVEREISGEKKLWAFIRFVPISNGGFTFLSLSSYDLRFKVGYQGIKVGNHWIELTLDANLLSFQYTAVSTGSIQANSYTVGANYLF